ncbi:hypothetical protein CLAIMM_09349 isoform 3, partial [Cladophialophora immunda]
MQGVKWTFKASGARPKRVLGSPETQEQAKDVGGRMRSKNGVLLGMSIMGRIQVSLGQDHRASDIELILNNDRQGSPATAVPSLLDCLSRLELAFRLISWASSLPGSFPRGYCSTRLLVLDPFQGLPGNAQDEKNRCSP